ncbi:hypothetical protein [Halobellus rubicundus]|uniref:Uncharacterized protein n=1 Tax=Halobellus rubicundus TaxID=2996466 RepID=A0ABD5ME25_9EURY
MTELTTATIDWSGTDEPIALTNIHILTAMAEMDPNESKGERSRYVKFGGFEYPLKYTVGRAIAHATGEERRDFHSDRGEELLEQLGFETVKKSQE